MKLITQDEFIEMQCTLERSIMKKYNYTFEDFELDDWRELFDNKEINHILSKYFGTIHHNDIKQEIERYHLTVTHLWNITIEE